MAKSKLSSNSSSDRNFKTVSVLNKRKGNSTNKRLKKTVKIVNANKKKSNPNNEMKFKKTVKVSNLNKVSSISDKKVNKTGNILRKDSSSNEKFKKTVKVLNSNNKHNTSNDIKSKKAVKVGISNKKKVISSNEEKSKKTVKFQRKALVKKLSNQRRGRGVVYLRHIPHGFYEKQIKAYFSQFGLVTALNLPRSKTGRIKGYAFIEFKHKEVAKIAAETMDNYVMFNRKLSAKYLHPSKQRPHVFTLMENFYTKTLKEMAEENIETNRSLKNRTLIGNKEKKETNRLLTRQKNRKIIEDQMMTLE